MEANIVASSTWHRKVPIKEEFPALRTKNTIGRPGNTKANEIPEELLPKRGHINVETHNRFAAVESFGLSTFESEIVCEVNIKKLSYSEDKPEVQANKQTQGTSQHRYPEQTKVLSVNRKNQKVITSGQKLRKK
ncbi:hypothetical protein JTB14_021339 [Gonioctena quinquepunctata]|nr:hypothetical protein JTB14_021339 [Gonioctena quinquepunctata]